MEPHSSEVVVLGGGPAGAAAATLLARRSHEVALVRPAATPAGALAESVPPSATRLLDELGLRDAVDRTGFHPNRGNLVWWAGDAPRAEAFPDGETGHHVDRRGLEDTLVAAAEEHGVRVHDGYTARAAVEGAGVGEPWTVTAEHADGSIVELSAPWVLDATGRRGFLAVGEGRDPDPRTTTLALLGRWKRAADWDAAMDGHTLVESFEDGWAWSVPLSDDVRCFSAVIDPRPEDLGGLDADRLLARELEKTAHIGPLIRGAAAVGAAWACPASLYAARRYARPGLLLVGDAGSFIDPLSSFGVKKALAAGWLAAVVAHTALVDRDMAGTAVDFFDRRERAVYQAYRRLSSPYFEAAAEAYGHPYWIERAEAARTVGVGDAIDPAALTVLDAPPVPEVDVLAAFDVLRSRERLSAVAPPDLRSLSAPAVEGYRVVLQERLASDAYPGGLRFVRNADLRRIVELAPAHDQVPELWADYNGGAAPVTLPDFLTALSTAFAAGLLVDGDD